MPATHKRKKYVDKMDSSGEEKMYSGADEIELVTGKKNCKNSMEDPYP